MGHGCQACLVTCEDFRLHRRASGRDFIGEFITSLKADCDLIARAGSIHDLVRTPNDKGVALVRSLDVAVRVHGVRTIYLVNHEDCGAYAYMVFENRESELAVHRNDLLAARKRLLGRYPGVRVVTLMAELSPTSDEEWVMKPVAAPN